MLRRVNVACTTFNVVGAAGICLTQYNRLASLILAGAGGEKQVLLKNRRIQPKMCLALKFQSPRPMY